MRLPTRDPERSRCEAPQTYFASIVQQRYLSAMMRLSPRHLDLIGARTYNRLPGKRHPPFVRKLSYVNTPATLAKRPQFLHRLTSHLGWVPCRIGWRKVGLPYSQLPSPSPEQEIALELFRTHKCNLCIEACAGAGKTTFILLLAQHFPHMNFVVRLYNNRLAEETREKAKKNGFENLFIDTNHGAGHDQYSRECRTDQGLKRVVAHDLPPKKEWNIRIDCIVNDEAQDITPIIHTFSKKNFRDIGIISDNSQRTGKAEQSEPQCIILGDSKQGLYEYNDSDSRFLTRAPEKAVFGYLNNFQWRRVDFSASNRLHEANVRFLKRNVLNVSMDSPILRSARKDLSANQRKPRYIYGPSLPALLMEFERLLKVQKVLLKDIMILAPSTRSPLTAKLFGIELAKKRYPVHIPSSEDRDIDPAVPEGKLIICSRHQAKGLERSAVVVLGFDSSYLNPRYGRSPATSEHVDNAWYVALSRARDHLSVIHDNNYDPLPGVDFQNEDQTFEKIVLEPVSEPLVAPEPSPQHQQEPKKEALSFSVASLVRHVPQAVMSRCLEQLNLDQLDPPKAGLTPKSAENDVYGLVEHVEDITETAVTAIYEIRKKRTCTIISTTIKRLSESNSRKWKEFRQLLPPESVHKVKELYQQWKNRKELSLPETLFLAGIHTVCKDYRIYKTYALSTSKYGWLTELMAKRITSIIHKHTRPKTGVRIEKYIEYEFPDVLVHGEGLQVPCRAKISGTADICINRWDERKVFEIKHTNDFKPEDILEVIIYSAILSRLDSGLTYAAHLLNTKTGECIKIEPKTEDSYRLILQLLINCKTGTEALLRDLDGEEFLRECKDGFPSRIGPVVLPEWFSRR